MSRLRSVLARSGPLLLGVHVATTACALAVLHPAYAALAHRLSAYSFDRVLTPDDLGFLIEAAAPHAGTLVRSLLLGLGVMALVGPVVTVAIARSLAVGDGASAALGVAVRGAARAVTVRAASWLAFGLGAGVASVGYSLALDHAPSSLELTLRGVYLLALAVLGLGCATHHDLALCALALEPRSSLPRALRAGARALRARTLRAHGLALGAALLLTLAADFAARVRWPLPGSLGPALSTALAQLCLFGALLVRAGWLSRAASSLTIPRPEGAALSPPRS